MELKACLWYLGDLAHYAITPDCYGIYQARLIKYEGPDVVTPPKNVLLVRSARHWVGSYEDTHFIQDLGRAIEERVRDNDPTRYKLLPQGCCHQAGSKVDAGQEFQLSGASYPRKQQSGTIFSIKAPIEFKSCRSMSL